MKFRLLNLFDIRGFSRLFVLCAFLIAAGVGSTAWAKGEAAKPADENPTGKATTKAGQAMLEVATAEYKAGDFKKASEHFHACFDVDPKNLVCLFNAARSEQRAFLLDKAEEDFNLYLKLAPASDEQGRKRAGVHLDEIRDLKAQLAKKEEEARKAANPTPPVGPTGPAEKKAEAGPPAGGVAREVPAPEGEWKRTGRWVALGGGAALLAVGAAILASASGAQSDLEAEMGPANTAGKFTGVGYADYKSRQESINSQIVMADALLVGGVAVAAAGAWMALTAPDTPSPRATLQVAPQPGGATALLAWRF